MEDKKIKASAIMDAIGDLPDDMIDEAALTNVAGSKKGKIVPFSILSGLLAVAVLALVININRGEILCGSEKGASNGQLSAVMDQESLVENSAAIKDPYSTATGEIAEISGDEITIKVISDEDTDYDSAGEGYPEQVYTVSDPSLLEGFKPGDQISYSYLEEDEGLIIYDIEKVTNED